MKGSLSAGGIVVNQGGLVLVVNQGGVSWSLPKGHLKKGEALLDAAKREVCEESGINDLELIADLGNYQRYTIGRGGKGEDKSRPKAIHMFLFRTDQEVLKPFDPRNPEARWLEKEKVADLLTHPKDKSFFLRNLSKITTCTYPNSKGKKKSQAT